MNNYKLVTVAACLAVLAACSDDSATKNNAVTTPQETKSMMDTAKESGSSMLDSAKDEANAMVESAKEEAGAMVDAAKDEAGAMVEASKDKIADEADKLLSEKTDGKYDEEIDKAKSALSGMLNK